MSVWEGEFCVVRNNPVAVTFEKPCSYEQGTYSMPASTMKYVPNQLIIKRIFLENTKLTLIFPVLLHLQQAPPRTFSGSTP